MKTSKSFLLPSEVRIATAHALVQEQTTRTYALFAVMMYSSQCKLQNHLPEKARHDVSIFLTLFDIIHCATTMTPNKRQCTWIMP